MSVDTAILFAFDEGYLQPGLVAVSAALRHTAQAWCRVLLLRWPYPTTPKIDSTPSHAPLAQGAFLRLRIPSLVLRQTT